MLMALTPHEGHTRCEEQIILPNDVYGALANHSPWATSCPWHVFVQLQAENGFCVFKWLQKKSEE